MSKLEDFILAKTYGEAIEKAENGESKSYEVKDADELFQLIKESE